MKVISPMLICVLCVSSQELAVNTNQSTGIKSRKVSITFIGTVKSIEPLGKRQLRVTPVDLDARFAVTVHIESVTRGEVPLEGDTDQVFAVHSPAKIFGAAKEEDIIGKKYRFKVAWNGVRHRFSDLSAGPVVEPGP